MSNGSGNNPPEDDIRWKMIGCRVTEDELHSQIYPMMHECYKLGIIEHDTVASFVRFCLRFWAGHYRMKKKKQFDMAAEDIEVEKKKLAKIIEEKEAWHKWDNSTPRVIEKAVKELEQMGEEFERDFKREIQQQQRPKPKQQRQSSPSPLDNLSLEDMMA
jgi:hypothetical protein